MIWAAVLVIVDFNSCNENKGIISDHWKVMWGLSFLSDLETSDSHNI